MPPVVALLALSVLAVDAPVEKLRILVLAPTSNTVDQGTLETVASLVSVQAGNDPRFDVITSSEVKKMAELEADKQSIGCEESTCLAELAGAMGASLVLFGDAGKLGSLTIVNLSLFDAEKAMNVGRASVQVAALEELPAGLQGAVTKLLGAVGHAATTATTMTTALMTEGTPDSAALPAPDRQPTLAASAWSIGFIGCGGGLAALGGLFDLLSPTSYDESIDPADAIGPTCMAVGLGALAAGIFANPFAEAEPPAPQVGETP